MKDDRIDARDSLAYAERQPAAPEPHMTVELPFTPEDVPAAAKAGGADLVAQRDTALGLCKQREQELATAQERVKELEAELERVRMLPWNASVMR